jgi:ABC-type oligopeptide transport system substrate-binding subunit
MVVGYPSLIGVAAMILGVSLISAGCAASAKNQVFFGKTDPPRENVLRYVSGSEPESLDPQISSGQNEARIYMALYEGLTEYDPKTSAPVPAIAERWEVNKDFSEITFHLRKNARFSNGDPITAGDFVYTIRRGLTPELASTNAALAYYIKYAEAYNESAVFVFDPASQTFLLEKDFVTDAEQPAAPAAGTIPPARTPGPPLSSQPVESVAAEYPTIPEEKTPDADTPFHRFMHSPARVVLPADDKARKKALDANPKLKAAVAGKQFVPVRAENVGVEAVDDYTLRISLAQPAPFFISLMPHQFFRVIHRKTVEQFGHAWTNPQNIVTSGPFKLEAWKPYDRIVVARDGMNWDASRVKLDRIVFYMLQDNTTIMNLYKAGELDATYNHTVPAAWLEVLAPMKDFMDAPEAGIEFYRFNTTNGPTKDVRVRKALNMALDKKSMADWRHVKPLTAFTPDGMFPGYPQPKGDPFDPDKAKRLLVEAGYGDASGNFDAEKFSASEIELITNPDGSNLAYADFIQAQWKQTLGATIQIRIMESKTFFAAQAKLDYKGISRFGWSADYMDPFTFLSLFYTPTGNNGTGWWDPKYVELLDEANRTVDRQRRYEILAQAENLLLDAQPVMPIVVPTTRWMKKPYVKGMYPNATTLIPWKWVYIERDQAKWDYGVPSMAEMSDKLQFVVDLQKH